jgi:hypothetical protein
MFSLRVNKTALGPTAFIVPLLGENNTSTPGPRTEGFSTAGIVQFLPLTHLSETHRMLEDSTLEDVKERASRLIKNVRQNLEERVSEAT